MMMMNTELMYGEVYLKMCSFCLMAIRFLDVYCLNQLYTSDIV